MIDEETALAHAAQGGHVCGPEHSLRAFALAVLRQYPKATDVFVAPEETFVQFEDEIIRYRNSPEMVEALDNYLLTGEITPGKFQLLPPSEEEGSK
jgi:hypothetical protein